jgi:TrpR family trp operon transcriptional repressor
MKKNDDKDGWQGFLDVCVKMSSREECQKFFDLFFTYEEKETFSSRYLIIKALIEGELTQREMAEKYHVSIAQITRGSNALKIIPADLRLLLKKWIG